MGDKKIIYNLEDVAKAIVDLISDGTQEGHDNLIKTAEEAMKKYANTDSPFWHKITSFFRHREESFRSTIEGLNHSADPIIRLQEIKKFFSEGGWELTSANTRFLIFMIRALKGYETDKKTVTTRYLHEVVVEPLMVLIHRDIDNLIAQQEQLMQLAEARKKELAAMREGQIKRLDKIAIFEDGPSAQAFALNNPEKQVFHLSLVNTNSQESIWQLTWYDLTGKSNPLIIDGELAKLLASLPMKKLPAENSTKQFKIKLEAAKLVEEMLARIQVLVEPEPAMLLRLTSTYVLTWKSEQLQLEWYDSLGKSQPIPLQNHPQLANWLSNKEALSNEELPQLKTYLQHIIIRREVDEVKHANLGQNLLKKHGITLVTTNNVGKIPRYKLIAGTYFLTREPDSQTGSWVLYQKQKGEEKLQKIDTDTWDAENWELFYGLLNKNDSLSAEQLSSQVAVEYEPCLMSKVIEKNKFYVALVGGTFQYTVMTPSGKSVTDTITPKELKHEFKEPLTLENVTPFLSDILKITSKRGHTLSLADELRHYIKNAERSMIKKNSLCVGVNQFDPQKGMDYSPCTFIVTKQDQQWQLYYIDIVQKAISVDLKQVDKLTELFDQWTEQPEALSKIQLDGLSQLLADYKPVSRIKTSDFAALEACLAKPRLKAGEKPQKSSDFMSNRSILEAFFAKPRKAPPPIQATEITIDEPGVAEASSDQKPVHQPRKLDITKYGSLFNHKPAEKEADADLPLYDVAPNNVYEEDMPQSSQLN